MSDRPLIDLHAPQLCHRATKALIAARVNARALKAQIDTLVDHGAWLKVPGL